MKYVVGIMLCLVFVVAGCSDDEPATPEKTSAAKSTPGKRSAKKQRSGQRGKAKAPKERASVTTPPLQLAQTQDATGTVVRPANNLPKIPVAPSNAPEEIPYTPTEVKGRLNVMLVLDASGSMAGPIESKDKLDVVRDTVKNLLTQQAPRGTRRSFGVHTYGAHADASAQDCSDSQTLVQLGASAPEYIGPKLDAVVARGSSPVARALREAALSLPPANDDADNIVILFADGTDTCNEDPCAAAKELHASPQKPIIHVVGFDLDQQATTDLRCVAETAGGRFFLARNIAELQATADQALNANVPYNLRMKVFGNEDPLPSHLTVYRSGTKRIIEEGATSGVKFFQLPPGSYDIEVRYDQSIEEQKPAKLLRGVEVQATARAEQIVRFDFGEIALRGFAPTGDQVGMHYELRDARTNERIGQFDGDVGGPPVVVQPGKYTVVASSPPFNGIPLQGTVSDLEVSAGEVTEHDFRFESGELFLRAQISNGRFIQARYEISSPQQSGTILSEGTLSIQGAAVPLPVGEYVATVYPIGDTFVQDPVRVENIAIPSQDMVQHLVNFPVGRMQLLGKNDHGNPTPTTFEIRREAAETPLSTVLAEETAVDVPLAPGDYHVTAIRGGDDIVPPPSYVWENITIQADGTQRREALFTLANLSLTGLNAQGNALRTKFTLYRSGSDRAIATKSGDQATRFRLTPGVYDIRAQDLSSKGEIKPTTWLRGVALSAGGAVERSIVFTAGRVRLTCRGTNNASIPCTFRLFTYGQDAPLVTGKTFEEWREFEMKPGYYYLEVASFDDKRDHELTKWINISVSENETVESIVRF